MSGRGRPLRFLVAIVAGWTGIRVAILWPAAAPLPAQFALSETPTRGITTQPQLWTATSVPDWAAVPGIETARIARKSAVVPRSSARTGAGDAQILAAVGLLYFVEDAPRTSAVRAPPATVPPPGFPAGTVPPPLAAGHWRLDGWAFLHGGSTGRPSLGGSQVGLRIGRSLDPARQVSAYARVAMPIDDVRPEGALGLQWQPTLHPISIFAEARRRVSGPIVPVAGVVGGLYRQPLVGRWRLDGYGQAGLIAGRSAEGFADGGVRATRTVTVGPVRSIDLGVGVWGGMQRGGARLDIGPTVAATLTSTDPHYRLAIDWRQRIAGHAAPASGPALTLTTGF